MYTKIKVNNKEYELKLTAENACNLEDEIGKNPLTIFMGGLPKFKDIMKMFQHCLTSGNAFELYDQWIAEGHCFNEFVELLLDVLKTSGFVSAGDESSKN